MQPPVRMGCAPPARVKVSKAIATSAMGRHLLQQRQYPVTCEPLVQHQPRNALPGNTPVHGSAVLRIAYSSEMEGGVGDSQRTNTMSASRCLIPTTRCPLSSPDALIPWPIAPSCPPTLSEHTTRQCSS